MLYPIQQLVKSLKLARKAKKISQTELAQKIGLPQSHVSNFESGKVNLTIKYLIEMARVLDLEVMLIPKKYVGAVEGLLKASSNGEQKAAYQLLDDEEDEDNG